MVKKNCFRFLTIFIPETNEQIMKIEWKKMFFYNDGQSQMICDLNRIQL